MISIKLQLVEMCHKEYDDLHFLCGGILSARDIFQHAVIIHEIKLPLVELFHKKYDDLHFLNGGTLSAGDSACC